MLNAGLFDYNDAYIIITIAGQEEDDAAIAADRNNKEAFFLKCALFIMQGK